MTARASLTESPKAEPEPEEARAAAEAGLRYVSDSEPGITRKKIGSLFDYDLPNGKPLRDENTLSRIRSLAVPPAYTDVWICAQANGHIQATGRDARGRKQYRYHPQWNEARDQTKYEHMLEFARALPALRTHISQDMQKRGLSRERVLATIVHLLETTLIRVGNEDYVQANKSYGLTTLRNRHVDVVGGELQFRFKGKSGKTWNLKLKDRRVANVIRACQELPGQHLFEYVDSEGIVRAIGSSDVNAYLKEVTGRDVTAKDFRTWRGTVLAAMALSEFEGFDSQAHAKKQIRAAIGRVAARLGNTPTICRKCYVHPDVLEAYLDGRLAREIKREAEAELSGDLEELEPEEVAVLALLSRRLSLQAKPKAVARARLSKGAAGRRRGSSRRPSIPSRAVG